MKLVARGLPLFGPSSNSLLENLDGTLVVVRIGCHVDLGLLKLSLVLALFLTHDHVSLSQVSFDPQAILFEFVFCGMEGLRLRRFRLEKSLDSILNDLPSLFHAAREATQWFFKLLLHLLGNELVLLSHLFSLAPGGIKTGSECA